MATITIDDDVFQRLSRTAARRGMTVEDHVVPLLETNVFEADPPRLLTGDERRKAFAAWNARIAARADRYPPGFRLDDSREALYAERDTAQMGPPT